MTHLRDCQKARKARAEKGRRVWWSESKVRLCSISIEICFILKKIKALKKLDPMIRLTDMKV